MTAASSARHDLRDPYAASAEERARAQQMAVAWDAYRGRFHAANPQWPLLWNVGKEPNPNVIINRCGPAADTDVAWLFGESVGIMLKAKGGKNAPKDAQEYVDLVWGVSSEDSSDDDKMTLLQELAVNGAVTGHAFLKIDWDAQTMDYPTLVALDSTQVRVQTAPYNCKVPICYIIEFEVPDTTNPNGGMASFRQVIELQDKDGQQKLTGKSDDDDFWLITDYLKPAHSQVYVPQGEPVEWPYPWAPIDSCAHMVQANRFYGRPRLSHDVIHINEAICLVASNINKIGMRHAHPILWTQKAGANQRSLRHEPGTIMEVSNPIEAVQAYGDLEHLMQFEEDLRADFDEETHVPAQAFGRQKDMPRTPVSGVAIRLGYGPLMADITKERRTYGALIRRVTQHLLELKNAAWANLVVSLGWQDPLPADDLQQAQVTQVALSSGVMSKETAAAKFGLEWDVEQERMQDEQAQAMQAVYHGAALPPAPGASLPAGADGGPSLGSASATPPDAGSQPAQGKQKPGRSNVNPNNPAAVVARQKVKAAFGKA